MKRRLYLRWTAVLALCGSPVAMAEDWPSWRGPYGGCWSSMMLANGNIYLPNQSGDVFVLRASPTFELLATNSVEESTNASLAASEGDLFFRTNDALWCFGSQD